MTDPHDLEEAAARLCTDCKWHGVITGMYAYGCTRPTSDRRGVAYGELLDTLDTGARRERLPGRTWFGLGRERCGPDAKFFTATPMDEHKPISDATKRMEVILGAQFKFHHARPLFRQHQITVQQPEFKRIKPR